MKPFLAIKDTWKYDRKRFFGYIFYTIIGIALTINLITMVDDINKTSSLERVSPAQFECTSVPGSPNTFEMYYKVSKAKKQFTGSCDDQNAVRKSYTTLVNEEIRQREDWIYIIRVSIAFISFVVIGIAFVLACGAAIVFVVIPPFKAAHAYFFDGANFWESYKQYLKDPDL